MYHYAGLVKKDPTANGQAVAAKVGKGEGMARHIPYCFFNVTWQIVPAGSIAGIVPASTPGAKKAGAPRARACCGNQRQKRRQRLRLVWQPRRLPRLPLPLRLMTTLCQPRRLPRLPPPVRLLMTTLKATEALAALSCSMCPQHSQVAVPVATVATLRV